MKKKDYIVLILCALLTLSSFLLLYFIPTKENAYLQISVNNKEYGTYSLDDNQTIKINDTNICEIKNGKVKMIHATCPDHLCIHSMAIDKQGGSILCLPNKVLLEIKSSDTEVDSFTH